MPNSFFRFKHFQIDQDMCSMKVTTEGCIFGASIRPAQKPRQVLDIGTGTGLLTLMLAQRMPATLFDAVEIDQQAAKQAKDNFSRSAWANRINIHIGAVQRFHSGQKYDLIMSNPPFYHQSLKTGISRVDVARHDDTLGQEELLLAVDRLLAKKGELWVIYPEKEADSFTALAGAYGLFLSACLRVHDRTESPVFRKILVFSRSDQRCKPGRLVIKQGNDYTAEMCSLLKDYYLAF